MNRHTWELYMVYLYMVSQNYKFCDVCVCYIPMLYNIFVPMNLCCSDSVDVVLAIMWTRIASTHEDPLGFASRGLRLKVCAITPTITMNH